MRFQQVLHLDPKFYHYSIIKMTQKVTLTTLLISTLSIFFIQNAFAQNWDYESYPQMPYNIEHLDAELNISDTGAIEGDLLYTISLKVSSVDSLIFDARGLEIVSTVINDNSKEFYIEGNHLIILTGNEYGQGESFTLRIQYRSTPSFGYHQTAKGTFFTSYLPLSNSHWLPVPDHPRNRFTSELIFTHPAGKTIVSNGRMSSVDVESVSEEVTTFNSNKEISAVDLSFSIGNLELVATTQNRENLNSEYRSLFDRRSDHQINIYSEIGNLDGDYLLENAVNAYGRIQDYLNKDYPFRDLSIVVLEDDFWETKSYGGGVIYLYQNRGNLAEQLQRAMTGIWIGSYVQPEQWSNADAVLALQATVLNELFDVTLITEKTESPYHVFDGSESSNWQFYFMENQEADFSKYFHRVREALITQSSAVLTWDELARKIYDETGYPFFEKPALKDVEIADEESYSYLAVVEREEGEQRISVTFSALDEPINELVSVQVDEYTIMDHKQYEISFTGESDTVVLNTSASTENIKFTITGRDDIYLNVEKPFEFWIYQLRNEEDVQDRISAARGLSSYSDNPDLQLALQDQMRGEDNSEVYAELLRTLSAVTSGASGTDQLFFDRLSSNYSQEVRLAAVEGLAYFRGNDSVISRLRSLAIRTDDSEIRTAAIRSMYEVTDADRFKTLAEDLITQENLLNDVPLILNLLDQKGEGEAAVRYSSTFLAEGFPYTIRKNVLDMILRIDQSQDGWENRLPDLLSDRDPRIRHHSLNALDRVSSQFKTEWIENRLSEEYDERVRNALERL